MIDLGVAVAWIFISALSVIGLSAYAQATAVSEPESEPVDRPGLLGLAWADESRHRSGISALVSSATFVEDQLADFPADGWPSLQDAHILGARSLGPAARR
jgi:hypothetical protein